jgi:hypothetical protein
MEDDWTPHKVTQRNHNLGRVKKEKRSLDL